MKSRLDLLESVHWIRIQPMKTLDDDFFFVSFSSSVKSVGLSTCTAHHHQQVVSTDGRFKPPLNIILGNKHYSPVL